MKEIKLTKGLVALVDDEDYEYLSKWKWCAARQHGNRRGIYAVRATYTKLAGGAKRGLMRMHRQILGENDMKMHVDHVDGNGLNNQRSNLRICTPSENLRNRPAAIGNKTGLKGISQDKHGKFVASLKVNGEFIYVGYFTTINEAIPEYNKASEKHHGEFGTQHKLI
jgi:hypothetical protein